MKLQIDKHEGICSLCQSEVPPDAVVCASCGAHWGSSTGKTRQGVYEDGKQKLKGGLILGLILLVFFLWTIFTESLWVILSAILGFFVGPACVGLIIGGAISMRKAKTNLTIGWWRDI